MTETTLLPTQYDYETADRIQFLGSEFLLWVLHAREHEENLFPILGPGGVEEVVELWFGDYLELHADRAEVSTARLQGPAPAYSPEAYRALQMGKTIRRAQLRLVKTEREWVFRLDADIKITAVKTPSVLSGDDDAWFEEKLYLFDELESAVDQIVARFVLLRLDPVAWAAHTEHVRGWLSSRASQT